MALLRRLGIDRLLARGLQRRILVWFLVLSLIPLFVSNTVGYLVTKRIMEHRVRTDLLTLTEISARQVAAEIERHESTLEELARADAGAILMATAPDARSALRDRLVVRLGGTSFSELLVLDSSGRTVASTANALVGDDWSEREVFRRGRETTFFSQALRARGGLAEPIYHLATPVQTTDGTASAVLVAAVGFERVGEFLRIPDRLGEDIHAFILTPDGLPVFVSHPHASFEFGRRLDVPMTGDTLPAIRRYASYDGEDVLGAMVDVPGSSWRFFAEAPVASVFGQLRKLALLAWGLEALFALLLVALVWVVAHSIVGPLRRLGAAAEQIRHGEFGVEVAIDQRDELGELGATFNQMSRELRRSADQIQELHQEELRRAAQLASVGELASGIAHEIKNPLIGVTSGLDLLTKDVEPTPRMASILRQIRTQLGRIDGAIGDLLSYARPRAPRTMPTDVAQLLERVAQLVRPQAEAADVAVEVRVEDDLPQIRVDPELMTQTLVNLALNGIQAMESISRRGVLVILALQHAEEICIAVTDTGPGIPSERLEEIFRPFFTTKHRGTGLGLAISRSIVERHGGRLAVETTPGRGSTFTMTFSAVDAQPALV